MKFRKLRIAWSAAWGAMAVLLIVMWVQSYWLKDQLYYTASYGNKVLSTNGEIQVMCLIPSDFHFNQFTTARPTAWNLRYSYITTLIVSIGVIPWLPWSKRFSLRTLLIATTLIAMVLGIIVWTTRAG
jgi:hypothetical protein